MLCGMESARFPFEKIALQLFDVADAGVFDLAAGDLLDGAARDAGPRRYIGPTALRFL